MPKVTGPLFSFTASGEFGNKSLIFSTTGNRTFCRKYGAPTNTASKKQQLQRDYMKTANRLWTALSDYQRTKWEMANYGYSPNKPISTLEAILTPRQRFIRQALDNLKNNLPVFAQPFGLGIVVEPRTTVLRILRSEI